jgi:hypothetical protein
MADPVIDPTPAAPTPGWSAKLIVFAIFIISGLPMSGLLDAHPAVLKMLVLVVGALGAIGYGGHSAALKRAYAAGKPPPATL